MNTIAEQILQITNLPITEASFHLFVDDESVGIATITYNEVSFEDFEGFKCSQFVDVNQLQLVIGFFVRCIQFKGGGENEK